METGKKGYLLATGFLLGIGVAAVFLLKLQQSCIDKWKGLAEKNRGLFLVMDQWLNVKQEDKKFEEYFVKNNYRRIAVYGMGIVGQRLVKELRDTGIEVVYGIDQNAANITSEIKVVTINQKLSQVDAIVVTLVDEFEEIYSILSNRMDCPLIAIEDIVNEI